MLSLIFWIVVIIFAVLIGIYVFLVINSIKSKSHNQVEASKVITTIIVTSLVGFMIFSWNTYSLLNSLESINNNNFKLPTIQNNNQNNNQNQNNNKNNQNNNKSDYYNF
jgi:glucan phosphoethanolaminetransferase (alkaline phosphatase superfamily)